MEIYPRNPDVNVAYVNGNIQIENLILLDLVREVARHMKTIHRTQALNIKAQYEGRTGFNGTRHYDNRPYITKGDFTTLVLIFQRYKDELLEKLDEDGIKGLTVGLMEAAEHETYIADLIEKRKELNSESNFSIVSRGQEPE